MAFAIPTTEPELTPEDRWWGWFNNLFMDNDFNDMDLLLYTPTKDNPLKFKADSISAEDFLSHGFDGMKTTKILAHGFTDTGTRFCKEFMDGG